MTSEQSTGAAPDWRTPSTDIACPLCGYNLRGLAEPRCPECGFAFAWSDLVDAKRDRHPWLFEHAGRQPPRPWRRLRAFVATYVRTALPWRFWRAVTPANPVHVGRLLVYWAIAAVPLLGVFMIEPIRLAINLSQSNGAQRAAFTPTVGRPGYLNVPPSIFASPFFNYGPRMYVLASPGGGLAKTISTRQLDALVPPPWSIGFFQDVWETYVNRDEGSAGQAVAIVLAWPWLSLAALLIFQASMRRAKVGVGHLLRVAVYGCDLGLLIVVGAVVLYGLPIGPSGAIANAIPRGPLSVSSQPLLLATAACLMIATFRLSAGAARYLQFHRPVQAVLASQAIVLLTVAVVLLRTIRLF